jgi:hypothetical protein
MESFIDGDLAANNGGWQWTASTGTDPQPYFVSLFFEHHYTPVALCTACATSPLYYSHYRFHFPLCHLPYFWVAPGPYVPIVVI